MPNSLTPRTAAHGLSAAKPQDPGDLHCSVARITFPDGSTAEVAGATPEFLLQIWRELKSESSGPLAPITPALPPAQANPSFEWFVRERYLPFRQSRWRLKTLKLNQYLYKSYLMPRWEKTFLRDIDGVSVQQWLNSLAKDYSESLADKLRIQMRAICDLAHDEGYLQRNPCKHVRVPMACQAATRKQTITPEEAARIAASFVTVRDRTIFRVLTCTGMRPQEAFALRWNDLDGRSLRIDETVELWSVVPRGKTKKSLATIGIPSALAEELEEWRAMAPFTAPESFIFSTSNGTHLDPKNWRVRNLRPAAKAAGVKKIDLRMLRRSFATWAGSAGLSLKLTSTQLRHSTITTTANVYVQPQDEQLLAGLDLIDRLVLRYASNAWAKAEGGPNA